MADQAVGNLSAGVFMDDIRSTIGGTNNYTPVSGDDDAWMFLEVAIAYNSTDIFDTSDSYLGSALVCDLSDKVKWVAIKNLSTTSTEGLGVSIGGDAAWNTSTTMILGNGEMIIFKAPFLTAGDLHGKACTLDSDGKPTAQGTATVTCQVAVILENVS